MSALLSRITCKRLDSKSLFLAIGKRTQIFRQNCLPAACEITGDTSGAPKALRTFADYKTLIENGFL